MNRLLRNFENDFTKTHLNFLNSKSKIKIINGHQNSLKLTLSAINLAKSSSNRCIILTDNNRFEPFHQQISTALYHENDLNKFEFVHGFLHRQTNHLDKDLVYNNKNAKLITLQKGLGIAHMPHLEKQHDLHVIMDCNQFKKEDKTFGLSMNKFSGLNVSELVIINRVSGSDATDRLVEKCESVFDGPDIEVFDFSKTDHDSSKLKIIWLPHEIESDNEHRLKVINFLRQINPEEAYSITSSSTQDFMKFSDQECLEYDILMGIESAIYDSVDNFVIRMIEKSFLVSFFVVVKTRPLLVFFFCKYQTNFSPGSNNFQRL